MDSTIHFFIPLGEMIPVPDRYFLTRKPSAIHGVNTDSPYPSHDGVHFIFHHVELDAPPHMGLEASLAVAARRAGHSPHQVLRTEEISKNYQTVVEIMVELGDPISVEHDEGESAQREVSPETIAFDHAINELNVSLRAIAFVQHFPMRSISRESIAPMIPFAFSTKKPWEMIGNDELPDLELGGLFNLNFNYPLSPELLGDFGDLDRWIDAALVGLSSSGPFTTYLDFRIEADLYRVRDGNYRAAAIMYAAACESLFEELHQHNLWEQRLRPEDAKDKFMTKKGYPKSIAYIVDNELGKFYSKEGWKNNQPPTIGFWSKSVAQLRNKAVHEGYFPDVEEMKKCVRAVDQLVTFLSDLVFENRLELPLTALAVLGQGGLESRGGWDEAFSQIEGSLQDVNVRLKTFRRWADALSSFRSRERPSSPRVEDATCMLVFEPTGQQSFYLVENKGVRVQHIGRDEVVFPPAVEQEVRMLEQSEAPDIPDVYTLPFDSVQVKAPTWGLYTYDVIPGLEVFLDLEE